MANITTYPFASQAVKYGADLVWTPMVHTDTIINNWVEAEKILNFHEIKNYLVQIIGSEPENFVKSVEIIEKKLKPLGIDLNFACPDKNIVKSGCGGFLLKQPENIIHIINAVKKNTDLPVSIKTRLGWENKKEIFDIVPLFLKAKIDLLTVHGRTVKQGFKGKADWGNIGKLKKMYPKLVICGSGDIVDWKDAQRKAEEYGVEGIMIGRSTLGRPWIFKEIKESKDYNPTINEIKKLAYDLVLKSNEIWGEKGIIESRKHFGWYFKGFEGAAGFRKKLMVASSLAQIKEILGV